MRGIIPYVVKWVSGIFMMLVLVWLTVSTPIVNAFQMRLAEREQQLHQGCGEGCHQSSSEDCNPFANTTEEKTESSTSLTFSEEYLHEHHEQLHNAGDNLNHGNSGTAALYLAFHGELLSPPPEL